MRHHGGSRRWADFERISDALGCIGAQFTVTKKRRDRYETDLPKTTFIRLSFETTTLLFNAKGRYLGREFMARDECDYFTPRIAAEVTNDLS